MDFKKPNGYKSINSSQIYHLEKKTYYSTIHNFFNKLLN